MCRSQVHAGKPENHTRVFRRCLGPQKWLDKITHEYFLLGDNAYWLSNKLLIPFSGAQKHAKYNCLYSFYLSRMWVQIKMAFEQLTTKQRIFRRNLDSHLEKNYLIFVVSAELHNFVIDNNNLHFQASDDPEDCSIDQTETNLPTLLQYQEREEVNNRLNSEQQGDPFIT